MIVTIDADYRETVKKGHVAGVLSETPFDCEENGLVTGILEHIGE